MVVALRLAFSFRRFLSGLPEARLSSNVNSQATQGRQGPRVARSTGGAVHAGDPDEDVARVAFNLFRTADATPASLSRAA